MDAAKAEAVESELDRLIERRAREERDANHVEELWRVSSKRVAEERRREVRTAWYTHHVAMREVHARLADEHEARALRLLGGSP